MENTELESITGAAGFSIAIKNVQIFHHIDAFRYCASDEGYIEFQNFFMHGNGNPAKFNYDFGTTVTDSGIIHYDVFETDVGSPNDWSGDPIVADDALVRGMILTDVPNWDQELGFTIGNIAFFDPDYDVNPVNLGSFTMGLIDMPRFSTYTSPRIAGSGIDFQTSFQLTIDKIGYAYNDSCDALEICPTYIGGSFVDGSDDPKNPASWMPNRVVPQDFGDFQIGDLFGDMTAVDPVDYHSNPAMIDSAECDIYPDDGIPGGKDDVIWGFLNLKLPMEGSLRFESATWYVDSAGPTPDVVNFGPGAIDGIQVHRLNLQLIP